MKSQNLNLLRPRLKQLINLGYKSDFTLLNNLLYSYDTQTYYSADQITVEDEYKFIENSRADYRVILFLITCDEGECGTIVTCSEQMDADLHRFIRSAKRIQHTLEIS